MSVPRNWPPTVLIAVGLLGLPGGVAWSGPAAPTVHDGSSAPVIAWRKAMEAGDVSALARMHDASTTGFPPDKMMVVGADAIMKDYASLFAKYSARVSFEDTHWVEQLPLVVSWGRFTLTLHPKAGGADVVSHGRFTDAAVESGAGWRYLVDHASIPKR